MYDQNKLFTVPPIQSKRKGSERRKRAHLISKGMGYRHRLYAVEYDIHGAIEAYGLEFVLDFAKRIAAGEVNCSQHIDRWAAHIALNRDASFAEYIATVERQEEEAKVAEAAEAIKLAANIEAFNAIATKKVA